MNCDSVNKALSLFIYGELSFEEEEAIHQHLDGCENCRRALERERSLHSSLDQAALEPPAGLLAECRRDLRDSLAREAVRRGNWLVRFWEWTGRPVSPMLLKPAGLLALVVLGFFAGRLLQPGSAPVPAQAAPLASQIRYLQPNSSGGVRIVLDETRERVVSGSLEDAATRGLLLDAARSSKDAGLRLDSVEILGQDKASPDIRQVLVHAVRNDPNPVVRLKAIDALKSYGNQPEVRQALSQALLHDDNLGVRTQAVDMLRRHQDLALAGLLQEVMGQESNDYIRQQCQKMLEDMNASLGTF